LPSSPHTPEVLAFDISENVVGYVVDAGVETKLTRHLNAGVDGLNLVSTGPLKEIGTVARVVAQGIPISPRCAGAFLRTSIVSLSS
jgi:hypothetical protein